MTDIRADLARMPRYKCHKTVHALKIAAIEQGVTHGTRLVFAEEGYEPLIVSHEWFAKFSPRVGGYFVVYDDGYQSFSPEQAFEEGYTRITE